MAPRVKSDGDSWRAAVIKKKLERDELQVFCYA
jgi:hypothetical protein